MRLGIDFGTCFSSAAYMDGETLRLLKDPAGPDYTVPSSVFVTPQEQIVVGKVADHRRQRNPERYRHELKRDLGRQEPLLGFPVEELIAQILGKIKRDADALMIGSGRHAFSGAVLTIPATYQEHKRALMLRAASKAGFVAEEVTLLEEPRAAALYYARENAVKEGETLLVYDLGGGTFDTALLQKRGDGFEYLVPPAGIERCGGIDFDRAIYRDLQREHPVLQDLLRPERKDQVALLARSTVGELCINFKHQLSQEEEVDELIPLYGVTDLLPYRLTRAAFNQMIAPALRETIACCQGMLQSAGLTWEQVDRIILVGGSCRIPYVRELLTQETGRPLYAAHDLELVVCQGAALYAAQHNIYVVSASGDADYTTIGAALKQAKAHGQIVVRPGTYRESLTLDREIEIIGSGSREQVVIETGAAIGLKMATAHAIVRGITLRHSAARATNWNTHGAVVVAQGCLELENCRIEATIQGVSVWGTASRVMLRGCHVHGGQNAGLAVNYGAQATLDGCELANNRHAGIHVRDRGSRASLQRCHIHDGKGPGISLSSEGQITLEYCEISGNASVGIQICDERSSATLRQCRIHDGQDRGIAVWQKGRLVAEDCDLFGNLHAGLLVAEDGSIAQLTQCRVYAGRYTGIDVASKGRVTLDQCDLHLNAGAAIRVSDAGSQATIQQCEIHEGLYAGVVVQKRGQAQLTKTHLASNSGPGIRIINAGSKATLIECPIEDNGVGVLIEQEGEGVVQDCAIENNRVGIYVEPGSKVQEFKIEGGQPLEVQNGFDQAHVQLWRKALKPEEIKIFDAAQADAATPTSRARPAAKPPTTATRRYRF
jgi:molecular chaperone DnaK (HSP70)